MEEDEEEDDDYEEQQHERERMCREKPWLCQPSRESCSGLVFLILLKVLNS